jgi:uncharacterized protein
MKLSEIHSGSVFLDTNILIYAYTNTRFTPACEELLDKIKDGRVTGYVNSTVIDELFHKVLLMDVYTKKGLHPADAITYLKQNPDTIGEFELPFTIAQEILRDSGLTVLDTSMVLDEALSQSHRYGLLFSDALHAACCVHYSIMYLATNDRDFSRMDTIFVITP